MHDNAPHTARMVTEGQITGFARFARSPDMNPMQHVRDEMAKRLQRHVPAPRNSGELRDILVQEWEELPQHVIQNVIQSMLRRLFIFILKRFTTKHQKEFTSEPNTNTTKTPKPQNNPAIPRKLKELSTDRQKRGPSIRSQTGETAVLGNSRSYQRIDKKEDPPYVHKPERPLLFERSLEPKLKVSCLSACAASPHLCKRVQKTFEPDAEVWASHNV
ncbi:hypothetical protein QE152_g35185 [Popillia japonica]|uniref:Transposase n=1 Tax=Popillia japonica TaxID=7064 RepID=A0AAW1IGZ0_POPJA